VLIVEDEVLIRIMLAEALEDEGYRVIEAGTVLEAIALLGQQHVDAIITDVDMPGGLTGLDLANFVHASSPGLAVVVTSGRRHLDECGIPPNAQFMPKPYFLPRMLEMLRACLTSARDVPPPSGEVRAA
jgi:DNA-binding NtrC family response regulator